jgi:threonine/homoserine/homoserine lactone efflux protein
LGEHAATAVGRELRGTQLRRALLNTLLITPSGALSPGPLSASAVAAGLSLGLLGGLMVALGHLIVELPYYLLLLALLGRVEERIRRARRLLDALAAAFMVFFAALLIQAGVSGGQGFLTGTGSILASLLSALIAGIILTGANAYFLAWWVTVGKPILDEARSLSLSGKLTVYGAHYMYDVGWLVLLAGLGGLGSMAGLMSPLMILLAIILLYYAAKILLPYITVGRM